MSKQTTGREIKFRAWDEKEKLMSIGMPLEWFITGDDADMEFPDTSETLPLKDLRFYLQDFVFMQFTGLKDKNGKEIYEGDIVHGIGSPAIVIFSKETASFMAERPSGYLRYSLTPGNGPFEIIGNIYEHPNLLP